MKSLNKSQIQAINHTKGPLLIIAGAGTGKTSTIIYKIKKIIEEKIADPQNIVALTFSDKSAQEIIERLDTELPLGFFNVNASTFHSFTETILRNEALKIGVDPNFKLLTDFKQIYFFNKNLSKLPLRTLSKVHHKYTLIKNLVRYFSRLQDEFVTISEYKKFVSHLKDKYKNSKFNEADAEKNLNHDESFSLQKEIELQNELCEIYETYSNLKLQNNFLDFGDLIFYTIKLFYEYPRVLKEYQEKFKFIFVDEFQDTNYAQYELIKLLCPPNTNSNLTVVGDDSQGIYKFRGATVSNILNFINDYNDSKQILLNENYRSDQQILDTSYQLIKNNDPYTLETKLNISKALKSNTQKTSTAVEAVFFENDISEAEFIVEEIKNLSKKGVQYKDIAVLARAKSHLNQIKKYLNIENIPYHTVASDNFFQIKEIRDLVSYLYAVTDISDSVSLFNVLSMEIFNIKQKDIVNLNCISKALGVPLFHTIEILYDKNQGRQLPETTLNELSQLPFNNQSELQKIFSVYEQIMLSQEETKTQTTENIIVNFLNNSLIIKELSTQDSYEAQTKLQNISKFLSYIQNTANYLERNSIYEVTDYLRIAVENNDLESVNTNQELNLDAVQLLTVHSSKGLEFDTVFIISLTEGRFPGREKKESITMPKELIKDTLPDGDVFIQEERRLFYVGMTRAKNKLYLTASKNFAQGVRSHKLSRFVFEANKNESFTINLKDAENKFEKIENFAIKIDEKSEFINSNSGKLSLSFSKLNEYEKCPLKYKFKYVLNIPTKNSENTSFGSSIHNTLQSFYRVYQTDNSVNSKTLINLLESYFIPSGYGSAEQLEAKKEEAKEMLLSFYKNFHSQNIRILDLEKKFAYQLDNEIEIIGKIDRVDLKEDDQIEIIDYKTGNEKTPEKLKNDYQLSVYALAAQNIFKDIKTEKIKLSYFFLQNKSPTTIEISEKSLEKTKLKIQKTANEIKSGNFKATPSKFVCASCEYRSICEFKLD